MSASSAGITFMMSQRRTADGKVACSALVMINYWTGVKRFLVVANIHLNSPKPKALIIKSNGNAFSGERLACATLFQGTAGVCRRLEKLMTS